MAYNILILGASYGSLLGTKLLMAGHNVTLVCREETARLINAEGTQVRLRLRGEDTHRAIFSRDQPGHLKASAPDAVDLSSIDLVGLAMQEPQYAHPAIKSLMMKIAAAHLPCLSIMNMPPLAYLARLEALSKTDLRAASSCPDVWEAFEPDLMTLCSPDPQAFRPPEEKPNVLFVGLPTNFKAAHFSTDDHNAILMKLSQDIDAVRLDGHDVPVKLRVHDSLFVPLAKWSMLMTGNYRCIKQGAGIPIREAVHGDKIVSQQIYDHVDQIAQKLGASSSDLVPFEKYAKAAETLLKPSSVARAISNGAIAVERVDRLVKAISQYLNMSHSAIDKIVANLDECLKTNQALSVG